MNTRLLKKFRKGFCKSVRMEAIFNKYSGVPYMTLHTAIQDMYLENFLTSAYNLEEFLKMLPCDRVLDVDDRRTIAYDLFVSLGENLEKNTIALWHRYEAQQIEKYKKRHPYRSWKIHIIHIRKRS